MIKQFRVQSRRLERLRNCNAIVTGSEHMRNEYLRHGIRRDRIFKASLPIILSPAQEPYSIKSPMLCQSQPYESEVINFDHPATKTAEWRLLFLGRMDLLKGGQIFLDALPQVAASLDRSLRVTFAGDGPDREALESKAAKIINESQRLTIEFTGWMQRSEIATLFESCDLLVLPSLWPEPFGLAGLEAGLHGVPSVAFAVGGISDWLIDGINGHLAPSQPPTARGLAGAILKCLRNRDIHSKLRHGAVNTALGFSMQRHMSVLLRIFKEVAAVIPETTTQGNDSTAQHDL
jgi:glycosyltransferase involved in cell wall biosynthesis